MRAEEIRREKSSARSFSERAIILFSFRGFERLPEYDCPVLGVVEKARAKPGATGFGPRFNFSIHRLQAVTSVLPVFTCLTPTFIAPHNSQSAIISHPPQSPVIRINSRDTLKPSEQTFSCIIKRGLHTVSPQPLIGRMGSEAERSGGAEPINSDDDLKKLETDYRVLQEEAQTLINDRAHLESEIRNLKQRANRLDDEVKAMRNPPLIIGTLQDVLDSDRAIVRSSNGTVFQVSLNQRIDPSKLKPGTRVALNQDTLAIIEVLHDAWDPMVSGAELIEKPEITYDEVAGLDEQIEAVREAIELPLTSPELFAKVGIQAPKGILLVGPPGCGKTLLAKAVANFTDSTFIRMVGSELAQKYIGEGGRMVRELFALAKEKSPSIIFLDEIDAIGAKRLDGSTSGDREVQRTLMQLLAELDGFDSLENVKIIAATNRPDILDDALLRPGRFDRIIEIPMPDEKARGAILSLHIKKMNTKRINVQRIVELTEGYSGAELKATCVESGMIAIREKRDTITQKDMLSAVKRVNGKRLQGGITSTPEALYG